MNVTSSDLTAVTVDDVTSTTLFDLFIACPVTDGVKQYGLSSNTDISLIDLSRSTHTYDRSNYAATTTNPSALRS